MTVDLPSARSSDMFRLKSQIPIFVALTLVATACSGNTCSDGDKALIHLLVKQSFDAGFTGDFSRIKPETIQAVQRLPAPCQQYLNSVNRQMEAINDMNRRRDYIDSLFR